MYSNKFAAKLVNIRQLCKKIMDNLNIFIVLSTYYLTFRLLTIHYRQRPLRLHPQHLLSTNQSFNKSIHSRRLHQILLRKRFLQSETSQKQHQAINMILTVDCMLVLWIMMMITSHLDPSHTPRVRGEI